MSNRHLNIFNHYTQSGSLPIENNISRGLAILLQDEPGLLLMLLSEMRDQGKVSVNNPQGDYEVDFQVECGNFEDYSKVIGVSLTATGTPDEYEAEVETGADRLHITDISIMYDDTLIIIEVKRTGEDCRWQLQEQVAYYRKGKESVNFEIEEPQYCGFSWTEMMTILQRYIAMQKNKANRMLEDYYNMVLEYYPLWAPQEPFGRLPVNDSANVGRRLYTIKQRYMQEYDPGNSLIFDRKAIPINFRYASECNIAVHTDFVDEHGSTGSYFTIGVWPSDTCAQYWAMKSVTPNKDISFLDRRYSVLALSSGHTIKLRVYPYMKFCHFNKGIMWLFNNDVDQSNHFSRLIEMGDSINGQWKRSSDTKGWDNFKAIIRDCGIYSDERIQSFEQEFSEKFEKSNRSYFTVSVGFEIFAYMPYDEVQKMDTDVKSAVIADLVHEVLETLKSKLE